MREGAALASGSNRRTDARCCRMTCLRHNLQVWIIEKEIDKDNTGADVYPVVLLVPFEHLQRFRVVARDR